MVVLTATGKKDLYNIDGNDIIIVNEEYVDAEGIHILSKDDLKGKRLQIEFYDYVRSNYTDRTIKRCLYSGDAENFKNIYTEGLNNLEILEYCSCNRFKFTDYTVDEGIWCDIDNIGYFIFNVLTENYENINLNDYKFLKDFGVIFDYFSNDKFRFRIPGETPNPIFNKVIDKYENVCSYEEYMRVIPPCSPGGGGLIFTKEQVAHLDSLLADYLKNNQTGKTRKLEI